MMKKTLERPKRGFFPWLFSPGNYYIEIVLILLWSLWVGRAYFNFDPNLWPFGREYALNVHTHYVWETAKQCGLCMLWNGSENGGAPAFGELQGAVLNPLVIVTTLLAGVVNGSKLILLCSLFLAGLAQWWLAKSMKVGRLARIWSAGMAVVGGHLAARMELGLVTLVLATAMCSLALAAGFDLAQTGKRRSAILFGVILAGLISAGQGYMQMSFLCCILPTFLVLLLKKQDGTSKRIGREFLLAGVLGLLLAGVFLVPSLHFFPWMEKAKDPLFGSTQSIAYIPLNLVINDLAYYKSEILKPTSFPNLYANYLGWVPVILSIFSIRFKPLNSNRTWAFFLIVIGLSFFVASGIPFKALVMIFPWLSQFRFISYFAGMANPALLTLAACGLDGLLKYEWPRYSLTNQQKNKKPRRQYAWIIPLLTLIPLFFSLKSAYNFGQQWLGELTENKQLMEISRELKTDKTEWISVPVGDHYWNISLLEVGMKISNASLPWWWKDRQVPAAQIAISREAAISSNHTLLRSINDLNIYSYPDNEYAYIQSGDQKVTCKADSRGGKIDVVCPETPGGSLIVMENNFSGWQARVDQTKASLLDSDWLSVTAPSGSHTFSFRYRPWDVWAGLLLSILGSIACVLLWIKPKKEGSTHSEVGEFSESK